MFESEIPERPERHPLVSLMIVLITVALGFVIVGPMVGFFFALPFYDGEMMQMLTALEDPTSDEGVKVPLYIIQGFATFIGLILAPAWFLTTERKRLSDLLVTKGNYPLLFLLTIVLVLSFMAVNSVFIEWNASVTFPDFAKGFEAWAREREDLAMEVTTFITRFDSFGQLLIALVVVAILPAIGEELVFRGIMQNQLLRATGSIHVAIWIAAILFSAIHFQFYGFVPRMLLGALFGYVYFWSGNLWYAIVAHFANNGISVIAMYLNQRGQLDVDLESPEAAPIHLFLISCLLTGGLLYYFYQYFRSRNPNNHPL